MKEINIVICEDDALIAKSLEISLCRAGYEVVGIAANRSQVERIVELHRPQLALMDVCLEGEESGIEVAQELWEEYGVPSIFLTAHSDKETIERAKSSQALGYLLKPFRDDELYSTVEIALHRYKNEQRVLTAMQADIEELSKIDVIETAVKLERDFMKVEQHDSSVRAVEQIVRQLRDDLVPALETVEEVSNSPRLSEEDRWSLKGALIHQDRNLAIIDRVLSCGNESDLPIKILDVQALVRSAARSYFAVGTRRLSIRDELPRETFHIRGHREQLVHIIHNIFCNSEQAMPLGGEITLRVREEEVDFPERFNAEAVPGAYFFITLSDNGPGIDAEILNQVLEPGFSASGVPLAAGLGLTEAYAIMKRHGGWLTVDAEAEEGTTVTLVFPKRR